MYVISNEKTKVPIRIWLPNQDAIEENCLEQAYNLAQLPFLYKWVSLMPDTHAGMGMPIGGVIATKNVIIPNAVGMDIGCGMAFVSTNIQLDEIQSVQTGNGTFIQALIGDIMRNIPVGFNHHKKPQQCRAIDKAKTEMEKYTANADLLDELESGYYQVGTLGGGNHFIEIQVDDDGYLGIMIHSGSRHFGGEICKTFNAIAKDLNEKWYSNVPEKSKLDFLPTDSIEGIQYINWMNLALDFAYENRAQMMQKTKELLEKLLSKYTDIQLEYSHEINCHHNYAALEHHYDRNVWVHRKGATRARNGELAVIPGAMGSYSYVVMGLGNQESFCSSSHGAGRNYSRKKAMEAFSIDEVMNDLKAQNIVLGKHNKQDVAEESRFAYKDIDFVMNNQSDLVYPVKRLKTIGVVKG